MSLDNEGHRCNVSDYHFPNEVVTRWGHILHRTVTIDRNDFDNPILSDENGKLLTRQAAENLIHAAQEYLKTFADTMIEFQHEVRDAEMEESSAMWEAKLHAREQRYKREACVYLVRAGEHYKIGWAASSEKRRKFIQLQIPDEVIVIHTINSQNPLALESYWHKRFKHGRIRRTEWFVLTNEEIAEFCAQSSMEAPK